MMHRILMNIVKPGQVAELVGEMGFAKVLPQAAAIRLVILPIEFHGRQAVQVPDHLAQGFGRLVAMRRAVRHQMVVIGKDGPGFKPPAILLNEFEQRDLKPVSHGIRSEQMALL